MQKVSRLFWPVLVTPKNAKVKPVEAVSKSQKLMAEMGLLKPASNGTFQLMPMAQRSINKLCDLVDETMQSVEGQKCSLPILTSSVLWEKSGRLEGDVTEFFMLRDRHGKGFLLGPTHEEAIAAMLSAAAPISYRQLPLRLYQIGPKFRDELKARLGLMRAKEFIMKDMYTFDSTEDKALETYNLVNDAYTRLFRQLQVPFEKVEASTGMMGGKLSHEYHYISSAGEDHLMRCQKCNHAFNVEVSGENANTACMKCSSTDFEAVKGMEVAHTFFLGDRYTKAFNTTYLHADGKPRPLIMGCYGIGISRILAASLEVLSKDNELKWPTLLTPYDVCVIGPKQGSKEEESGNQIEDQILHQLEKICGRDLLHDDRKYLTIGKRLMESKKMGYPVIVVVGSKSSENIPKVELHLNETFFNLDVNAAIQEVLKYQQQKTNLRL